jgi:F0F1-type ATP synthase membrane subunit b/b'
MTTLGERIKAQRNDTHAVMRAIADAAKQAAQDWAKAYTDNIKTAVQNYVDNRMTQAKAYVDNQIASLVANNNLIPPS